jgi:hypothetical protein
MRVAANKRAAASPRSLAAALSGCFGAGGGRFDCTIGKLIDRAMQLEAHCHKCGQFALLSPRALPLPPEAPLPALEGRFRCERCGSRETTARTSRKCGRPKRPSGGICVSHSYSCHHEIAPFAPVTADIKAPRAGAE